MRNHTVRFLKKWENPELSHALNNITNNKIITTREKNQEHGKISIRKEAAGEGLALLCQSKYLRYQQCWYFYRFATTNRSNSLFDAYSQAQASSSQGNQFTQEKIKILGNSRSTRLEPRLNQIFKKNSLMKKWKWPWWISTTKSSTISE